MMKAVTFENQKIALMDVPLPQIAEGEALVKMMMAGICATDIELFKGYLDFQGIPGHEFVGQVEKAPSTPELVGMRVVADINIGCGQCPRCRRGDARHCPSRQVLGIRGRDGGFAEYCAIPVANLRVLPEGVETIDAVFAEPLAAAFEITQQVDMHHRSTVAVMGDGKMGLLCALALDHYTTDLTILGRHAEKLAIAANQGIATCNTSTLDLDEYTRRWKGAFDVVIDATGHPDGVNQAISLVRPEGVIVVKTTHHQPSNMNLAELVVHEITLVGSRCGDIGFAVKCLDNRWITPSALVEKTYPFADFKQAFDHARSPGSKKILLAFE